MTWCTVDARDEAQVADLHAFLACHYVASEQLSFQYTLEFLRWALSSPGCVQAWHVGLRAQKTNKLMGFIMGMPVQLRWAAISKPAAAINFLAIHTRLRNRRLAAVLIQEVTRRIDAHGCFLAMYTSGTQLPRPVCSSRYYHRPLDYRKLVKIGFCTLRERQTMARMCKLLQLPPDPALPLQPMVPADVPSVAALLQRHLAAKAHAAFEWSEVDVAHFMLPRRGILDSYVLRDGSGCCTDVCSFFHVPSKLAGGETLHAAFAWHAAATSVPLEALMESCLVLARRQGADVFNALELLDNAALFQPLKFERGTGVLNLYLYNMPCAPVAADKLGILLL
jgi:glycylpeptide N-tetradecanoyltransferase